MSVSLHDLVAPPPRARFREELWERAAAAERRRRHVRRAVLLAAAACAVAATASAGVVVFQRLTAFTGTYDRTMSCPVPIQGGAPVVRLEAHSTYSTLLYGRHYHVPSGVAVVDGQSQSLGAVNNLTGYGFPKQTACTAAAPVPLARSGLPLYEVFTPGDPGMGAMDSGATCLVGARVTVRVRAVVRNGRPQSGTLELWTGAKKLRPVAYLDWKPKRVATYFSDDCSPP